MLWMEGILFRDIGTIFGVKNENTDEYLNREIPHLRFLTNFKMKISDKFSHNAYGAETTEAIGGKPVIEMRD